MGDRGIPASYRHMDGFGSHTYQWTNAKGESFFVKYHFKTDQGIRCLTADEAAKLAGEDRPRTRRTWCRRSSGACTRPGRCTCS